MRQPVFSVMQSGVCGDCYSSSTENVYSFSGHVRFSSGQKQSDGNESFRSEWILGMILNEDGRIESLSQIEQSFSR